MCINFGLFSGGCKTRAENNVETEMVTKITQQVLLQNQTNVSTIVSNVNAINIIVGGDSYCNYNIKQSITSNSKVYNNVTLQQAQDINEELKTNFSNNIEAVAISNPDTFSAIFGKQVDVLTVQNVKTKYLTEWDKYIDVKQIANVFNDFINKNTLEIHVKGDIKGKTCNFKQDILQKLQVQNLVTTLQDQLLKSSLFSQLDQDVKALSESKTTFPGLFIILILLILGIIFAVLYFGAKIISNKYIIMGIVFLCVLFIILLVLRGTQVV